MGKRRYHGVPVLLNSPPTTKSSPDFKFGVFPVAGGFALFHSHRSESGVYHRFTNPLEVRGGLINERPKYYDPEAAEVAAEVCRNLLMKLSLRLKPKTGYAWPM